MARGFFARLTMGPSVRDFSERGLICAEADGTWARVLRLSAGVRPLNERAMKPILLLSVLSILVLAACGSRGTGQTCTWQASDDPSPLDLQDQGQGLHLMSEAVLVEDLAVRYADFHRGHRSGHLAGIEAYHQTREQCMAMLFEIVANHHGVSTGQVRDSWVYRRAS